MFGIILTLIKPLNSAFVGWCLYCNYKVAAALGIAWLILCDIFDGVFFRLSALAKTGEIPKIFQFIGVRDLGWFRRVCDVVGDRVAVEFCMILMIIWYEFPWWLYSVELIREFFLIGIWVYGRAMKNVTVRDPNLLSRLSMLCVGLMGMTWLLQPKYAVILVLPIVGFGIPGAIQYYRVIVGSK